jgi:glutathione S-transferase
MKLFDISRSPNCRKVRVLARELDLPLEVVAVDFTSVKEPAYLAKNPTGKVPTFVDDDGFVLWESNAILIHLAEKRPELGLYPTEDHARADVLRWLFFLATHLQPWLSLLGQERLIKPQRGLSPDPGVIALAERELARFLPTLDAQLTESEYLAESYSIADISIGSSLDDCELRGVTLEPYTHLGAWRARLRQRPAWAG